MVRLSARKNASMGVMNAITQQLVTNVPQPWCPMETPGVFLTSASDRHMASALQARTRMPTVPALNALPLPVKHVLHLGALHVWMATMLMVVPVLPVLALA